MNPYGILPPPWCVDVCVCEERYSPVCVWVVLISVVCVCPYSRFGMWKYVCCWYIHMCISFYFPPPPSFHIYPTSLYSQFYVHLQVCGSECVSVCVEPHFLCACWSILAFEEKCAVHSPRLFPFQHWIRDGAMICGNNFLNTTNLCFSLSLSLFTVFLSLSLSDHPQSHPSSPELANLPCCVRLMKDKKGPIPLTLSHGPSEDCTNLPGS